MKKDTLLARAGRDPARHQGMVNTPVFRASTVLFPDLESYESRGGDDYKKVRYGLLGTPTTFAFEEAVARMEGGYAAVALPSGLAAIAAALCAYAQAGAHLLIPDSCYGPTRTFCDRRLKPFGVEIEYYDPVIGAAIERRFRPNTCAVLCEAPGSMSFEMQDIPAIAEAAHRHALPVLADTTWGTPYFFRSFERGVDVSIHAATKYIAGHSDVIMGVIVTNEQHWLTVRRTVDHFGYGVSPDDCYLALRGFRTIGVRMRQQMANALKIARWLQSCSKVRRVIYPALEGDPGHAIWKRDFTGAASLFSFVMQPAEEKAVAAFMNALEVFGIGSSWGGFESLAIVARIERSRTATKWDAGGPTIRLHVGLEDPDDLIADLERGFAAMTNP
ncbi:MAG TPA: cystathionine beta-lyase [Burkholderiales bacterium]|jgi:cystathionine beta-lyase|nr:cystathionine beta-lyase [Burkholderiales bacterium]